MSQLVNQLAPHMRAFFQAFFQSNQGSGGSPGGAPGGSPGSSPDASLEALRERVGAELEITVGRYRRYHGPGSLIGNHLFLPSNAIHVERELVYFAGSAPRYTFYQASDSAAAQAQPATPPTGGTPPAGGTPPPGGASPTPTPVLQSLPPYQYTLVRVDERVDPLTDEASEMTRLFRGLDAPVAGAAPPATPRSQQWSQAIIALREREPNAFSTPLESLANVPGGIPATDLAEYKRIMYQLGTYLADGRGTYYPKRNQSVMGEGGLPIEFPEGTTIEYRRLNTREIALEVGQVYCMANMPDGWGSGIDRQVGSYREIIFKLERAAEGGTLLVPISWSTRTIAWNGAPPRDFYDFCFFICEVTGDPEPEIVPEDPATPG